MYANKKYSHVFTPIQVGPMTVKNRIQFSPMVSGHADTQTGTCTNDLVDWIGAQARGGAGIVTIGSTPIDYERGRDFYGCLSVWRDSDFAQLKRLSAEAHRYGAKLSVELIHAGCIGEPAFLNEKKAWVPSVVPGVHDGMNVEEIKPEEMQELIQHWVAAAKRCCDAGFDMVMIHMAHGNLVSSFLSPLLNHRTDEYGGSPENRWRFPLEILKAVREAIGPNKAIEIRVSGDERCEGCTTLAERIGFIKKAQEYANMVIVSTGLFVEPYALTYMIPSYYLPDMLNVDWAAEIKKNVDIPVSVVGGINTIDDAEEILASGKADIVAMARPMIAEQNLVELARTGHEEDITPCLRCNQCLTFTCFGSPVRCSVNPRAGRAKYDFISKADKVKKVLVIGGGPAGMTAARTLRQRGHEVTLVEAGPALGGRLVEASALWCKSGLKRYFKWAVAQTEKCGATIMLNTKATPELISKLAPDAVIVATGGREIKPAIEGIDLPNVVSVADVDCDRVQTEQHVVICGGGLSGSECALSLAHEGKEVTIIDPLPADQLCREAFDNNRNNLFHILKELNVERIQGKAIKFSASDVTIEWNGETQSIPCDTIITSFGLRPDDEAEALTDVVPYSYKVGDCNKVGIVFDANRSAFDVAVEL